MRRLMFIFSLLLISPGPVTADRHPGAELFNRESAARWLKSGTPFIPCGEAHYIYGVGYIDGSYMERIFYVRGSGNSPDLSVRFRGDEAPEPASKGSAPSLRFVMEVNVPEALHAIPSGGKWQVSNEGWESALRFKYTSWYGTLTRSDDGWQVEWQGYRRPMLPSGDEGGEDGFCALFAGH